MRPRPLCALVVAVVAAQSMGVTGWPPGLGGKRDGEVASRCVCKDTGGAPRAHGALVSEPRGFTPIPPLPPSFLIAPTPALVGVSGVALQMCSWEEGSPAGAAGRPHTHALTQSLASPKELPTCAQGQGAGSGWEVGVAAGLAGHREEPAFILRQRGR